MQGCGQRHCIRTGNQKSGMGKLTQADSTGLFDWAIHAGVDSAWTQRVGALCELPALLRQSGLDPASLFANLGLPLSCVDQPDKRLEYATAGRLLAAAARAADCPHLGLLAGQAWTLEHMGLVGELMRHAPTLAEALRTLAVYHRLESEGATVYLSENKDTAVLGYVVIQPQVGGIEQLYDTALASGVSLVHELLGQRPKLQKAVFARPRPVDVQPYRDVFRARVQFDSDHTALYLSRRQLEQPIPGADPKRRRQLEDEADATVATDLVVRLHRALRLALLSGIGSGDHVAEQLAMHRRTLHRRLRAHGTTFQQVLDGVRWDLSRQLLGHTTLALGKVAAATGYADTSTFVRAFRRWSGTTPAQWRAAHAHES